MEPFKLLLEKFDATLKKYNKIGYENLLPGLPGKAIDKGLSDLGIKDSKIKMLYEWKSGIKDQFSSHITTFGWLIGFDEIKDSVDFDDGYDPLLIPIMGEVEDILLFNTNRGPHYGKLYLYSVPMLYIEHPISFFDSLDSMLVTFIEAYESGVYSYDAEKNWLDHNTHDFANLAAKINIKSAYWKDNDTDNWEKWYAI